MKKILILIALLLLVGCSEKKEDVLYKESTTESGFDTKIDLIASVESQSEFDTYFKIVKEEFWRYHQMFDKYNDYDGINNIKTINDNAGIKPIVVDPITIEMLLLAKEYTELSDGYFDITFGSVLEIWHDYREEGELLNADGKPGRGPDMAVLEEAKQYTGWQLEEIDETNNTVYLTNPRTKLDVGAIAKGYATELVALTLEEQGLKHAIVSGGGNIRTIGTKLSGTPWSIGVEEPSDFPMGSSVDVFTFPSDMSVVTSGDYQRYYLVENEKRMSHLINPHTLMPEDIFKSVTIFTPNSSQADALSTAVYMMTYEEALEFKDRYNEQYPDQAFEILWISDTETEWTESKGYYIKMTPDLHSKSKNYPNP